MLSCGLVSSECYICVLVCVFFFSQAEDGIRDLVRSRGLGDVYKRQLYAQSDQKMSYCSSGNLLPEHTNFTWQDMISASARICCQVIGDKDGLAN